MPDVEATVRAYYRTVGDLNAPVDALAALLHPDVRVVEHPNAINPHGAERGLDGVLAGYQAGKQLLSEQSFDVHEVLVAGRRAAVRATWTGRLAIAVGPLPAGAELTAHLASLITIDDGLIREHETFDCYEPLPVG
jgi:ketosteroid isomerase-like protein